MFQRVDNSTPISNDIPYRFQSFIGPMRGFYLNARNGNSALIANAEVRWPLFRYFIRKPIKSDFVENFQMVTFFDAGTAWTGANPYSDDNLFNQTVAVKNPVTVTISNNREPIVYGYGFGLRSRVLGYFVRADWAWGVDDGRILDRVFYLSLNMDF
jgi:outer membrane protein assembly factor BamA